MPLFLEEEDAVDPPLTDREDFFFECLETEEEWLSDLTDLLEEEECRGLLLLLMALTSFLPVRFASLRANCSAILA